MSYVKELTAQITVTRSTTVKEQTAKMAESMGHSHREEAIDAMLKEVAYALTRSAQAPQRVYGISQGRQTADQWQRVCADWLFGCYEIVKNHQWNSCNGNGEFHRLAVRVLNLTRQLVEKLVAPYELMHPEEVGSRMFIAMELADVARTIACTPKLHRQFSGLRNRVRRALSKHLLERAQKEEADYRPTAKA